MAKLLSPEASISGTYLNWTQVPFAVEYAIYKNGTELVRVGSQVYQYSLNVYGRGVGDYTVRAIGDGSIWENSDLSNSVHYSGIKLDTPRLYIADDHYLYVTDQGGRWTDIFLNGVWNNNSNQAERVSYGFRFDLGTNYGSYQAQAIGDGSLYTNSDKSIIVEYVQPQRGQLVPPYVRLQGNDIVWQSVPNAFEYDVFKDNIKILTTSSTTLSLSGRPSGSYTVVAISNDPLYDDSEPSNSVVWVKPAVKLATPVLSITDNVITITVDSRATSIDIYLDNYKYDSVQSTGLTTIYINAVLQGRYTAVAVGDGVNYSNSDVSNGVEYTYQYLMEPRIKLEGSVISWNAVPFAEDYAIYKDGTYLLTTSATRIDVRTRGSGEYKVKALASLDSPYRDSDFSNTVTYLYTPIKIRTPIISLVDNVISWATIEFATSYEVYKDGDLLTTVTNTSYTVTTDGVYSVRAITTNELYSNSDLSNQVEYSTISAFTIHLYKNATESSRLDKTEYLTEVLELRGAFREACDIVNPSILIEYASVFNANYAYIPILGRYYFINGITSVRTGLWQLDMECDVLMSYKAQIGNLTCFVNRQQNENNPLLIDNMLPSNIEPDYQVLKIYNSILQSPTSIGLDTYCILLTVGANVDEGITKPSYSLGTTTVYAMTPRQFEKFSSKVLNDNIFDGGIGALYQNASEGIMSIKLVPFDINAHTTGGVYIETIRVGLVRNIDCRPTGYQYSAIILDGETISFALGSSRLIPKTFNNFLDYNPYTSVELYIPTYGFIDLDVNKVIGKECNFLITLDPSSCKANLQVITNLGGGVTTYPIMYHEFNLGIDLPITTSSFNDTLNNLIFTGIKAAASVYTMGVSSAAIEVTAPRKFTPKTHKITAKYARWEAKKEAGEETAMANFISDTTVGVVSGLKSNVHAGTVTGGWDAVNMSYDAYIYITRPKVPILFDPDTYDAYKQIVGVPSDYVGLLSALTGYTEVSAVHMEGFDTATPDEIDEIENLLKAGVIL